MKVVVVVVVVVVEVIIDVVLPVVGQCIRIPLQYQKTATDIKQHGSTCLRGYFLFFLPAGVAGMWTFF